MGIQFSPKCCCGCCQCADHVAPKCNDTTTALCKNGEWVCGDSSVATCSDSTTPTCAGCPCCLQPCYQIQETPRQYVVTGLSGFFANDLCNACSTLVDGLVLTQSGCAWDFSDGCISGGLVFGSGGDLPTCSTATFNIAMTGGSGPCPTFGGEAFVWVGGVPNVCCAFTLSPGANFPGNAHWGDCCTPVGTVGDLTFTPVPGCNCGNCCNQPTPTEMELGYDWTGAVATAPCLHTCLSAVVNYVLSKATDNTSLCSWSYTDGTTTVTATLQDVSNVCTWSFNFSNACFNLTYAQTGSCTVVSVAFPDNTVANSNNCVMPGGDGGDPGGAGGGGGGGFINSNGGAGGQGNEGQIVISYGAGPTVVTLNHASASPWTVPVGWDNSNNKIECWGCGGNGASGHNGDAGTVGGGANGGNGGGGGGGGEYAASTNLTYTVGAHITFSIGAKGAVTDTNWNSGQIVAKHGTTATGQTGAAGGTGGTGTTLFDGGAGGNGATGAGVGSGYGAGGGGGGGCGGPNGVGVAGSNSGGGGAGVFGAGGAGDNGSGGAGGSTSGANGTNSSVGGGGGAGGDGAWIPSRITLTWVC